jgi:hypothetical protein
MSGATLYDLGAALSEAFAEIDAELAETDGEFTEAMQQRLDAAEGEWQDKVQRVALYIRSLAGDAAAIATEEARLKKRRGALEKRAAWLKDVYLRHALDSQQRTEVPGVLATVKIGKNPPSVECDIDPEFVDPAWVRHKHSVELDKAEILAAHKRGDILPPEIRVVQRLAVKIT